MRWLINYESPHQGLRYLQIQLFSSLVLKELITSIHGFPLSVIFTEMVETSSASICLSVYGYTFIFLFFFIFYFYEGRQLLWLPVCFSGPQSSSEMGYTLKEKNSLIDKQIPFVFNPITLWTAKTLWSFGLSECNRVNSLSTRDENSWISKQHRSWWGGSEWATSFRSTLFAL